MQRKCEWCGIELAIHKPKRTRFCNQKCSALWRNAHFPTRNFSQDERQKRREAIIKLRERPGMREKLRENMNQIRAATPKGPTVPQKMLADSLPEAVMEYGLPNFMKIDLAVVRLKLAIEVDGQSHKAANMKERDTKKEQLLKKRGWTLLRFWNAEILRDLPSVLNQIQAAISSLETQGAPHAVAD